MARGEGFWPQWEENKMFSLLLAIFLVYLIVFVFVQIRQTVEETKQLGYADQMPPTISISAEGEAYAVPDIGRVEFTVMSQASTSSAAQDAVTVEANALLAKMRELGLEEKDLQTSSYNVYPLYDYDVSPQQVTSFEASQSLTVTIRDLSMSDRILEEAGNLKVDYIGNVVMEIDDAASVQGEAREEAIEKAREQAEQIARAMGQQLGEVVSYYEYAGGGYYPYERAMDMSGGAPEIAEGENEVTINVSITYGLE